MADSRSTPGLLGTIFAILSAVIVTLAVGVWALGTPGNDPVGATVIIAKTKLQDQLERLRIDPLSGQPDWEDASMTLHDADPVTGAALIQFYGCGACHIVPGVSGARGTVGPTLAGFRDRAYVGGVLPNQPGDLVAWLMDPTVHAPETAMPDLGVTNEEARDMAAYLYTLRGTQ